MTLGASVPKKLFFTLIREGPVLLTVNRQLSTGSHKPETKFPARSIATARKRIEEMYEARNEEFDTLFDGIESEIGEDEEDSGNNVIQFPVSSEKGRQEKHPDSEMEESGNSTQDGKTSWAQKCDDAGELMNRSRGLLESMHEEDQEEAIDLHDQIESAITSKNSGMLAEAFEELKELLFFVEGK